MSDLYLNVKRESWTYVALLGLLAIHIGIIISILAFEGALEANIQTYMQVVGILCIFAGLVLIFLSAFLRNQHRKGIRWATQHNRRNFRPTSYNIQTKSQTRIKNEKKCSFTPTLSGYSSKATVSPWYSESSGPLPDLSSNTNIEEWLKEHRLKRIREDSISSSRLSSLM